MNMDVKTYPTANSWFSAMREKGYDVPITLCQAIEKVMKDEKIGFPEAYKRFESKKTIKVKSKVISYTPTLKRY